MMVTSLRELSETLGELDGSEEVRTILNALADRAETVANRFAAMPPVGGELKAWNDDDAILNGFSAIRQMIFREKEKAPPPAGLANAFRVAALKTVT